MKPIYLLNLFISILIFFISYHSAYARNNLSITTPSFCSTEILAKPLPYGYTWTLTSRLGELLDKAEKLLGERDKSWTILGVEFSTNNYPQTWYPGISENRKDIIIQLTANSALDEKKAIFQLAHEVIHLLSPNGESNSSTVLEEGLATYFSIHIMRQLNYQITPNYISSKAYEAAYWKVKKLIDKHPNMFQKIKYLRKNKSFTYITYRELQKNFKKLTKKEAIALSENFQSFSQRLQK